MNINVKGVFFTVQKAIPLPANPGAVILNSSISGVTGSPMTSVYAATKAAVRSFARTFSAELIGRGVRVNVVSPGPIKTPAWERFEGMPQEAVDTFIEQVTAQVPLKRYGLPEEVAAAVLFLASEESNYIVGSEIFVDGGVTQI